MKKNITSPIVKGARGIADLGIKALGQAKIDWFRLARGQVSDKHMSPAYSGGVIPLIPRFVTNVGGTSSAVSLILGETRPGKSIIKYRQNRRERIDRMKDKYGAPFRAIGRGVSRAMPWYNQRFEATQKGRERIDKFNEGQASVERWMHGGISGMQARIKRKKMLKRRKARKKSS